MKHLFITLTIACALLVNSTFANDEKISNNIIASFQSSFKDASEVNWSRINDLYVATFTMQNQKASAYYNAQGNLIATGRYITYQQVPIALFASLQEKAKGYHITGIMEVSNEDGIHYYVSLENEKQTIQLKSIALNNWSLYKKMRK